MEKSNLTLLEAYVSQLPNQVSYLTKDEALMDAVRVLQEEVKRKWIRVPFDSLGVAPGFQSIQVFQKHVLSNLCALHKEYSVYYIACHIPCTISSEVWRRNMENMNIN